MTSPAPSSFFNGPPTEETLVPVGAQALSFADIAGQATPSQVPAISALTGQVATSQLQTFSQNGSTVARGVYNKLKDVINIWDWIPVGTNTATTDCSAFFQAAINYLHTSVGGGKIQVPAGIFSCTTGFTLYSGVSIEGAGLEATFIVNYFVDTTPITFDPGCNGSALSGVSVYGKGMNGDTGAFGASSSPVVLQGVGNIIRDCFIEGGAACLSISGTDCLIENVITGLCYGSAIVTSNTANWYIRNKFDTNPTGVAPTNSYPYPAWAAGINVTVGQLYSNAGYLMQVMAITSTGTTGGGAPTLKNYGLNITDNQVTWQLFAPVTQAALSLSSSVGVQENHFTQCDFAGAFTPPSLLINGATTVAVFDACVFSGGVTITNARWVDLHNCEFAGTVTINSAGGVNISENGGAGVFNVSVAANVNNFGVVNNDLGGGVITVAPGTSDHYCIFNNRNYTITDGGTGTHKTVELAETLPLRAISGQFNPTGTASLAPTHVMAGCGYQFTPQKTGNFIIAWTAGISNNTANAGFNVRLRYGTGTPPTNGAAETGTQIGTTALLGDVSFANQFTSSGQTWPLTGLAVGTTYWLDIGQSTRTGGTATMTNVQFSVIEI